MVLANSQSVQLRPFDNGQMTVSEEPRAIHPNEDQAAVRANLSDSKTTEDIYSEKRMQFDFGKSKFCGNSALFGFEEEVNDTQSEFAQTNIFIAQSSSKTSDCYRNVTADKSVTTEQIVSLTCPVVCQKEVFDTIEVPESDYSEGTSSENVYIHLRSDPILERSKSDLPIKVSSESLNGYNVSKNYKGLFEKYCRVTLNHVWKNTNLEWEKISDPSKHLLWEIMPPQCLYTIDYDKSTPYSSSRQIFDIEQPATDKSSHIAETKYPNTEIDNASDTVNSSTETDRIETPELNPASVIHFHVPPVVTCLSFSSNASSDFSAVVNVGKLEVSPMPVPQTFNFETDTPKQEVYNMILESGKVDRSENDAEFETHLPLKKRKLSMPVPITSSLENIESNEISYPATPMLSIAEVYIPMASRPFKTPAEKKQLPADPPPVPIRYDPLNDITPFTCSMNTFSSTVYRLNECPYNVKLDCPTYCPPPVIFPPESLSGS